MFEHSNVLNVMCSNPSTSFNEVCTWVNPGTNLGWNSPVCGGESEVKEGQMVSPMFGNLPSIGYNFLGCTRRGDGLTQVALGFNQCTWVVTLCILRKK